MSVPQDSELPWPQCLGSFDEESCRFFLRQIGEKIVPAYPFSLGMEEVYGLILERYGYENTSDAISVLQELLEDDEAAAGQGDDGDVWRSWRHNWRHRNDDHHDPFIPRVGNLVLRPPTTTRIRLLKAANFATYDTTSRSIEVMLNTICNEGKKSFNISDNVQPRAGSEPWETIHEPDPFCRERNNNPQFARSRTISDFNAHFEKLRPAQNKSHRKLNSDFCDGISRIDSSFDFVDLNSIRQPWSTSTNDLSPLPKRCTILRGGEAIENLPRKSLPSMLHSAKNGAKGGIELYHDQDTSSGKDSTDMRPSDVSRVNPEYSLRFNEYAAKPWIRLSFNESRSQPQETKSLENDAVDVSITTVKENQETDNSEMLATRTSPNHNRRAANREARLIDGALFNGRCSKEKPTELTCAEDTSAVKALLKRSPQRLRLPPTPQQLVPRQSWLHSFWSRLRSGNSAQLPFKAHKRHQSFPTCVSSNLISSKSTLPPPRKWIAEDMPSMSIAGQRPDLGMDGTFDVRSVSGSTESDNNKPLPLSPSEKPKCPVSNEAQQAFFAQVGVDKIPRYNRSPTLSSRTSKTLSNLDHEASDQSFLDFSNEAYVRDEIGCEDRLSFTELRNTNLSPAIPLSFTSIANQNPYSEDLLSATSSVPPLPVVSSKNAISSDEWPFRKTQNGTATRGRENARHNNGFESQEEVVASEVPSRLGNKAILTLGMSADARERADASTWGSCDTNTVNPKTSRTRSQSPVKKLLGLTKVTNPITANSSRSPTKAQTPLSSNTKRTLKLWGHKLRYGFLSSEETQLHQEQMMECYASHDDVHIATPSKANRSTFPVSVRPVDQARMLSEVELMICIAANKFLLREAQANRITAESVARFRLQWETRNKPQVVEFLYDLATQRDLIMANLGTVAFHGDAAADAVALSSILHQWKVMAREMTPRTLCNPDSVVKRWLHDLRRILETLGASEGILEICDSLSLSMQKLIILKERERTKRRDGSESTQALSLHRRSASDDNCYHISHAKPPKSLPTRNGRVNKHQLMPTSNSFTNGMRSQPPLEITSRPVAKLRDEIN